MIILRLDKNGGINKGDIKAFEHDNKSETYIIQLYKNNEVYDLTNKSVELTIVEKKRKYGDMVTLPIEAAAEGKVKLEIVTALTKQDGTYDFKLTVKDTAGLIETFPNFQVKIDTDITKNIAGEIVADKNFTILTEGLKALSEYEVYKTNAKKVPDIEKNVADLGSQLDNNVRNLDVKIGEKASEKDLIVERNRINQLTRLSQGSTTGDAELIDIRAGAAGEVFESAGTAVRYQIDKISKNRVRTGKNLFDKTLALKGKYLGSDGSIIDNDLGFVTNFISVNKNKTYYNDWCDSVIALNSEMEFVKILVTGSGTFSTDDTIYYIQGCGSLDKLDKTMIHEGEAPEEFEEYKTYFEADTSKLAYSLPEKSLKKEYFNDKIIDENHCSFIEQGKNLFDKSSVTKGYYIDPGTGNMVENSAFWVSDYIGVLPNTQYTIRYINQFSEFVNKGSNGYDGGSGYSDNLNAEPLTFTTKETTNYIRFCGHNSQLETNQLEKGDRFTEYEDFSMKIKENLIPKTKSQNAQKVKTPKEIIARIFDKSVHTNIKLVGDSITHGQGGSGFALDGDVIGTFFENEYRRNTKGHCWANSFKSYLEEKFNCTATNNAVMGTSTVELVNNFDTLVSDTDDIVICMYGTNNRINTHGKESFEPNLQTIIDKCKSKNIELIIMANIACSIAQEENKTETNFHMEDVNHSIAKVCSKNGMQYINVYQKFLDYCWLTGTTIDSLLADGLHPNDKGYDVMFKIICAELGIVIKRDGATW